MIITAILVVKILFSLLVLQGVIGIILTAFQSPFPNVSNGADTAQGINVLLGMINIITMLLIMVWTS